MNNDQFRRLLLANSTKSGADKDGGASFSKHSPHSSLGSKQKSSIPTTPRSVLGSSRSEFAAQLAERNDAQRPAKRFRTSAPRGSRLADGYVDRARERTGSEEDDRAVRLKAIEESFKNGEIDQDTYDKVRGEIAGGDLSSTHLVKGLDLKLLKRVKEGENVFSSTEKRSEEHDHEPEDEPADVDDEFEQIEQAEVTAISKEKIQKKGQLAVAAVASGQKRTRDQILAELKAARDAAKAKAESTLGSHFKKIGQKQKPGSRIERDSKGREVLVIVDEDGHERRKVRKVDPTLAKEAEKERAAFIPQRGAAVLGMEVPEYYRKQQAEKEREEDDGDGNIFDDAGSDYDPLAGLESGSDDDSAGEEESHKDATTAEEPSKDATNSTAENRDSAAMPPPPPPTAVAQPRNYFKDSRTGLTSAEPSQTASSLADPAVLAALRKAKALGAAARSEAEEKEAERQKRLKDMLQRSNRDDADLDMGFGTNRLEDEEDLDEAAGKVKLSKWGDDDADDDGKGGGGGAKAKRERAPKKRKGGGNNVADVLQAMARQKAEGK